MSIKNIFLITIVGVLVFISAQNTQHITLKLLAWEKTFPLIVLIYIIFFAGFIVGMLRTNLKHLLKDSKKKNTTGSSLTHFFSGKKDDKTKTPGDTKNINNS